MPRLIRKAIQHRERLRFIGFPRQWIPLFEYFGINWNRCCSPSTYIPIVSDVSDDEMFEYCERARRTGTLRDLVESIVVLDPVLADFLYITDNTIKLEMSERTSIPEAGGAIKITNWQSYGRREIRELVAAADLIRSHRPIAVVLPCARGRPYGSSRTHRRLWQQLEYLNLNRQLVHQVVITSIGVIPEELWTHSTVTRYDSGVPDIYRTLLLSRKYFSRNPYRRVIDCLQFRPYSDVLTILAKEGVIADLEAASIRIGRQFYVRAVSAR
jgi:predicted RNA-binding protein